MGREFYITRTDYKTALNLYAEEMLQDCQCLLVTIEDPKAKDSGKWTMSRLWRSWMGSTSEFLHKQGMTMNVMSAKGTIASTRPITGDDCHDIFCLKYLGTDNQGSRYSWTKHQKPGVPWADKGMRLDAMQKHQVWMLENGIKFLDPADSEFRQLCDTYGIN
jgi:hypothetical protein